MAKENSIKKAEEESNSAQSTHNASGDLQIAEAAMDGINLTRQQIKDNANPKIRSNSSNVADKFKGLPMRELISAPLIAVCEAQQQLAATAWDFYNKIGFEKDTDGSGPGKPRLIKFDLERPVKTSEGIKTSKITVNAPFIGLVPIPSLLIEKVDIDFQMEVTDTTTSKNQTNVEFTTKASAKWFTCSVEMEGKVGTSRETTRTTNQTAKYQVHVTAAQQQQTEGLSKLMDIMASCIEPIDGTSN